MPALNVPIMRGSLRRYSKKPPWNPVASLNAGWETSDGRAYPRLARYEGSFQNAGMLESKLLQVNIHSLKPGLTDLLQRDTSSKLRACERHGVRRRLERVWACF